MTASQIKGHWDGLNRQFERTLSRTTYNKWAEFEARQNIRDKDAVLSAILEYTDAMQRGDVEEWADRN